MKTLRVGFVDYRLENYHANVFLAAIRDELKDRGATVAGCTALDNGDGRAWAKKNDVAWFDSPAALNETVNAFMVLAPSNPELHLKLCEMVLPHGKPTYVDKTFAPDAATAKRIFELADKHNAAMQTTSALRYTNLQSKLAEIGGMEKLRHMVAWGGGRSFDEYAIHPVEMVVSCMGPDATSLMRRGDANGKFSQLLIDFSDNRTAVVNVACDTNTDFAASLTTPEQTVHVTVDASRLFTDTAAAILDFLRSGKPNIDRAESLMIRRILDAASAPTATKQPVPLERRVKRSE